MTITVVDSATGMQQILAADASERDDLIRELWAPMAGMYHFIPGGIDLAAVHARSFGFRPEAEPEQVQAGLDALVAADAWGRIERALHEGAAALAADPGVRSPT